ncbi:MAG: D-alanyl-D-alanine carboxypeptidase [Asticcacaulis sp.]
MMRNWSDLWGGTAQTVSGARRIKRVASLMVASALVATPVLANDPADNPRYAAIVVDAQSGEVFYSMRADSPRYPASITKVMTLYMVFEAMARGEVKPDDLVTITPHAASMPPTKAGLKAGETITVDMAMRLVAAYSANDLAAALGEHIAGSESRFAALMTVKAHELGMTRTNFVNASGLPDDRQVSSARDIAILARAVMRDYPQYYEYFHVRSVEYRGRTFNNHNPLLAMPGVDGMKTGFIRAAGYNLVASQRKGDRRLISVMLGGSDKAQRREHVTHLMQTGFNVIERREKGEAITIAQAEFRSPRYNVIGSNQALFAALGASEDNSAPVQRLSSNTANAPAVVDTLTRPKPEARQASAQAVAKKKNPNAVWGVQVGAFKQKSLADNWLANLQKRFDLKGATREVTKTDAGWYRSRFTGLTQAEAQDACKAIKAKRLDCMVIKS